ncbi:MAG: J domain-containing protein [Armatimonadota bacterium]|nr:J domain-containing protein [Armatimonadota bacterium]
MAPVPEWERIEQARKRLGLGRSATLAEIHHAYRARARELHPDRRPPAEQERCQAEMAAVNEAYRILRAYCAGYRFSFDPDDVRRDLARRDPGTHWHERFGDHPV